MDAEGRTHMLRGADPGSGATWLAGTVEKVRPGVVAARLVTDAEIDEVLALLDDPGFSTMFPLTMAAWGRRP